MTSARVVGPGRGDAAAVATRARRAGAVASPDTALAGGRLRVAVDRMAGPRRRGIGVIIGVALALVLFAIVAAWTLVYSGQAHIDRVNAKIAAAESRAEELRVQLAALQSPQYVTSRATSVLGMIPAPTPVYLQQRSTDDARAAELPPTTPLPAPRQSTPTTAAPQTTPRASSPTTTVPRATTTTVKR